MRVVSTFICILLSISTIVGQVADSILVSDLGSSAKMIAIGNIEGFSSDASVVFDNPAGLAYIKNYSFSIFSSKIMDEAQYLNISAGLNSSIGKFGLGYYSVGVDGIANTIEENNKYLASSFFNYNN